MKRAVGMMLAGAALCVALTGCDSGMTGPSAAEVECEARVKERLRSPSTADFSGTKATAIEENVKYAVSGSVDAQNGFGATVRSDFQCTVEFVGDGKVRVRVDELEQR